MKKLIANIREYFDNSINPITALALRKANRSNAAGAFCIYLLLLLCLSILSVLFSVNFCCDVEIKTGDKTAFIIFYFGFCCLAEVIAFCSFGSPLFFGDCPCNGDETFRLIPIPYMERFNAGLMLMMASGLLLILLTLPFVIFTSVFDWFYISLLFVPTAQLAVLWTLVLLAVINTPWNNGFRNPLENFITFLALVVIFVPLLMLFYFLTCDVMQNFGNGLPAHPVIFITAAAVFFCFFIHTLAAVSYMMVRYYLTNPKLPFMKVFVLNIYVYGTAMFIFFAAATAFVRCY